MHLPTVLITGASGFLGGTIATVLSRQGFPLCLCGSNLHKSFSDGQTKFFSERLPSNKILEFVAATKPDWVVHCAGPARVAASFADPAADFHNSVTATDCLYQALQRHAPSAKVLFMSSAAVYGQPCQLPITRDTPTAPISPYGEHKQSCERLGNDLRARCGIEVSNWRIFSAYGPRLQKQVLWDIFRKSLAADEVVLDGTGHETRDLIYSLDIAKVVLQVITSGHISQEIVNIGSGRSVSIATLAQLFLEALNYRGSLRFSGIRHQGAPQHWSLDARDCLQLYDGDMISLENGIAHYTQWLTREFGVSQYANRVLADAG
jgi:UDP-glucose 4-epimerase